MKLLKKILCMLELSIYGCVVFVLLANFICHQALADTPEPDFSTLGRINLMEENDYFTSKDDRHYTQGVRLSYLTSPITPDGSWDQPYGLLSDNLPIFQGTNRERKYEWTVLGQSLFTPQNTSLINPSLKQRPYACLLYTSPSPRD